MLTLRKMTVNNWSQQRQKLRAEAKQWGLDEEIAFSVADRELVNWTAEELSTVLRKVKRVKPGNARTIPSDSHRGTTAQSLKTWIKAPHELVKQSAAEHKALCINAKGKFSLRENDYFAVSHVWIEGIQGNQMNKGVSSTVINHIFKSVSSVPDVEWLWLDVLAIPSGHDTLSAAQEIEKIDIINSLGSIYEKAKAIIIFDALVKHLDSTDPVDVAAALVCGKWMSRVWTYQEIKLARKAIVLTGAGPIEYSVMVQELRKKHNNMHWDADLSNLTQEQRPARFKFRMLYMTLDLLQYDPTVRVSIPDIVFACKRRTTGNDIDYVRAFFPVLELK